MNKLDTGKRALIIRMITEGASMRAASRVSGVSLNTVMKIVCEVGEACSHYQYENLVNLPCTELQLDEIWSFVGCRDANKARAKGNHPGDVWTWTALCPQTKLIPGWMVGDRSAQTANDFCRDLGKRFKGHLQITSDGHPAYRFAVAMGFDPDKVDFAQLIKIYGQDKKGRDIVVRTEKKIILRQSTP